MGWELLFATIKLASERIKPLTFHSCSSLWWQKAFSFPAPKYVPVFKLQQFDETQHLFVRFAQAFIMFSAFAFLVWEHLPIPFQLTVQQLGVCGQASWQLLGQTGMTDHPRCIQNFPGTCLEHEPSVKKNISLVHRCFSTLSLLIESQSVIQGSTHIPPPLSCPSQREWRVFPQLKPLCIISNQKSLHSFLFTSPSGWNNFHWSLYILLEFHCQSQL